MKLSGGERGEANYLANWNPTQGLGAPHRLDGSELKRDWDDDEPTTTVAYSVDSDGIIQSRTVMFNDTSTIDPKSPQKPLQWSASDTAVSVTWWSPDDQNIDWKITKDGAEFLSTRENSITDDDPSSRSDNHNYVIQGADTKKDMNYYYEIAVPKTNSVSIGRRISDPKVSSADANSDIGVPLVTQKAKQGIGSATWRSFIPDAYVSSAWCPTNYPPGSEVKWFGGDGRGYSRDDTQFPGKSRTEATLGHSFYGGSYFEEVPYTRTGDTTTYDANKKLVAKKNAGTSGYVLGAGEHTSTYGERTMNIAVKDPLCNMAANIDIRFYFRAQNDGTFTINGTHDRAPSHEILFSWGDPSTGAFRKGCAYRFKNRGLQYLIPPMPNSTMDVRFNAATGALPSCTEM